jgi:hypothetical protein
MHSGSVVSMESERTSVYVHELGINGQKSNFTHDLINNYTGEVQRTFLVNFTCY